MIVERLGSGIISIAEAKLHARVDGEDDDLAFDRMCITAVLEFEDRAHIALLSQAVRVSLPNWPDGRRLTLPIGPVQAPESVTLFSAGSSEVETFTVTTGLRPAVCLTETLPPGRIVVEYDAGFGARGDDVPEDIRHALIDQVMTYHDARGATDGKLLRLSPHFARIAARYRGVRA